MNRLSLLALAGCLALAGDPISEEEEAKAIDKGYQVQQQQVQVQIEEVSEEVSETADSLQAMVCRYKDVDALAAKAPDIPDGWVVPELSVYEALGATCSQIPERQRFELIARYAVETFPCDGRSPAVQCSWTHEDIWANKGGPPSPPFLVGE